MSVIFETLQKLSRSAQENDAGEEGKRPRRNVYALKTVLMSPVAVVLITLAVFGLGYGLVYGLRQVQRSARMDPAVLAAARAPSAAAETPPAAVAETSAVTEPVAETDNSAPIQTVVAHDVPPPPDIRHLASAGAEDSPPAGEPVFAGPDVPPPSNTAMEMDSQDGQTNLVEQGAVWKPPLADPSASAYTPGTAFSVRPTTVGQDGGPGFSATAYVEAEKNPPFIHVKNESQIVASLQLSGGERSGIVTPDVGHSSGVDFFGASREKSANVIGSTDADAMAPSIPAESLPVEAAAPRTIKRLRIPRYTRLVERLQRAIVSEDQRDADRLLGEFTGIKGDTHPYIIKLKAFRLLQAQDYAAAEVLLGQVLVLDKGDRDAQMNMAVVEANTGRLDAARRRLVRLADRFPDDEAISVMRRQLK